MQTRQAIEAIWKIESARLIGGLTRLVRDVGAAEDLAQEALVVALERWPTSGIPENPGAWLMTTAQNRARDLLRCGAMQQSKQDALEAELPSPTSGPSLDEVLDDHVGDDVLKLVLVACHPVLSTEAQVALTLRLVAGLTTEEIARAYLAPEPTVAQRIVRAKRTLSEARVPFEVPCGPDLRPRVAAVLHVLYLVFNEGYAATQGDHWMRPALCEEALRLGRMFAQLVPDEAEAYGLVALMELHASRSRARLGPAGEPVLLMDQDRSRWDRLLIHRGLAALSRAEALARPSGAFTLQAAIAACHARARSPQETDWPRIVALYDALTELTGSPVVALNRAVAVGMAFGPQEALPLVDELADEPALKNYHLLPSVRADLLAKLGRTDEARAEYERAAALATNRVDRELLSARARALGGQQT